MNALNKYWRGLAIAGLALAGAVLGLRAAELPADQVGESLLLGWFRFLQKVLPQQEVSPGGIVTALVCVVLLVIGLQSFLGWLARSWPDESGTPRRWRLRWTAYLVGMTVLMFAAGTAFVGVVHQSIWLATSPEPRTALLPDPRYIGSTTENMKMISYGLNGWTEMLGRMPLQQGYELRSWQTVILPSIFIESSFYDEHREWNDPANKEFCRRPVAEYLRADVPGELHDTNGYAISHYAGNLHPFHAVRERTLRLQDVDGSTLLFGEAAGNFKPWADPENLRDPLAGIATGPDGFGNVAGDGALFGHVNGRVSFINKDIDPAVLKAISGEALRTTAKPNR